MFDFLREKVKPKRVAGLQCQIGAEGKSYHLAIVQLIKSEVELEKSELNVSVSQLNQKLEKSIPICLSVDGKGVLTRKIDIQEYGGTPNSEKLIPQLLPNAKATNYHLQVVKGKSSNRFVSIIRKDVLEGIIAEIENAGFRIVQVSAGPFAALFVRNDEQLTMNAGRFNLEFDGDDLTEVSSNAEIDEKHIQLVPQGNASQFFLPESAKILIQSREFGHRLTEFLDEQLFRVLGWGMLATILAVLLVNYLVFDQQNSRNQELAVSVESYKDQLNYLSALKKKTEERQEFLAGAGWTSPESKTSFYADELAANMPSQIKLTGMQIFPRTKNKDRSKQQKWLYQTNEIVLTGSVTKSTIVNDWMKELSALEWAESVELVDYTQNSTRLKGEFEIRIVIG